MRTALIFAVFSTVALALSAQERLTLPSPESIASQDASAAYKASEQWQKQIGEMENLIVAEVITAFAKKNPELEDDFRLLALIKVLGTIGRDKSIRVLAQHINYQATDLKQNRAPDLKDAYPCYGALLQIGPGAMPILVDALAATDDALSIVFLRRTLLELAERLFSDAPQEPARQLVRSILSSKISAEKDNAKIKRLRTFLDILDAKAQGGVQEEKQK